MSFTTNKPADGATPPAVFLRPAGRASAPISRAQLVRSVRLHPWLALSVGCVVAGGLAGYALSGRAPDLAGPVPLPVALLVAALPLGLLCGLLAAMLLHSKDARIYGAGEIDELIGLPPLAILPARGEVASGAYEAHLLRLAGAIAGANRSRGAKSFLLTAVSEGTRVEPLVSALRRKFEETGFRLGVASAADLFRPAAEVSSRGFVAANLARLTVDDCLLLVEAEPLLHSAETEFVAHCVDATILVVECALSTRQELWRAAAELERMQVSGVAAVLEELPMAFAGAHYRAAVEAAETATSFPRTAERSFAAASDLVSERAPEAAPEAVSEPVDVRAPVEKVQPVAAGGPVLVSGGCAESRPDSGKGGGPAPKRGSRRDSA